MSRITKWKLEKTKVKVVFRLQFHATHIPQPGWDKLFISLIPADSGKASAKTTKANVRSGACKWGDPIYETTRLLQDMRTKQYDDKFYKIVVAMGSSRSSVLGEVIINLADYADALKPSAVALPLQGCDSGAILHVTIQLLTSKTGFREFELQRELRERGLQSTSDESSARRTSSSEDIINNPMEKVNTRVRFKEELPPLEEVGGNEESDSAVGFDGSSTTSEGLYAEKQDTSSTLEIESLKSTISGDFVGPSLCQNPQPEKVDPSDRRLLPSGSNDWVHGWSPEYSVDNDLGNVYEENNRLRVSLETAESSILELKTEVNSLRSHADEIGTEAQSFAQLLSTEIASGEHLAREISVLRLECSNFKADLERLKSTKQSTSFTTRGMLETGQDALLQELQLRWLKGLLDVEDKVKEIQSKASFGSHEKDFRSFNSDLETLRGVIHDLKLRTGQASSGSNLANVKDAREVNLYKADQLLTGTRFSSDFYHPDGMVHSLDIPSLVPQEIDSAETHSVMEGFALIKEVNELKAERETLTRKMDQMECYYEALVQELEETQRQMMGELQSLRTEHSTCLYTISATKAEMENMHQGMNKQIMRFSEEKCSLDSLNKDLERRAVIAEAALKRARLNYSVAVGQLQKDLELLSVQVLSMHETNENLIKQAFSDSSPASVLGYEEVTENKRLTSRDFQASSLTQCQNQFDGVKKQHLEGEIISDDLKRSLLLQKGLYQKVEEEVYEVHLVNVYLDIFSKTLQGTLLEASADFRLLKDRFNDLNQRLEISTESKELLMQRLQSAMDEVHRLSGYNDACDVKCNKLSLQNQALEAKFQNVTEVNFSLSQKIAECETVIKQLRSYESKLQTCCMEKLELENVLKKESLENANLKTMISSLQEEMKSFRTEFDELATVKESLQGSVNFLHSKLQNLVMFYNEKYSGPATATDDVGERLETQDAAGIMNQLDELLRSSCEKILQLTEEQQDLAHERDAALMSLNAAKLDNLGMKNKFGDDTRSIMDKLNASGILLQKLQSEVEGISSRLRISSAAEETYVHQHKELMSAFDHLEAELQQLTSKNEDLGREIMALESATEELGRLKVATTALSEETEVLKLSVQNKDEESAKLEGQLNSLRSSLELLQDELDAERSTKSKLESEVGDLTSQLNKKHSELLNFDQQNAELVHLRQLVAELELEKSSVFRTLSDSEKSLKAACEECNYISSLEAQLSEMHELSVVSDVRHTFIQTQYESCIEEFQKKCLNVESKLSSCLATEAHYIEENAKLRESLTHLRSELDTSISQNRILLDTNSSMRIELDELTKSAENMEATSLLNTRKLALEVERLESMLVEYKEENDSLMLVKGELEVKLLVLQFELDSSVVQNGLLLDANSSLRTELDEFKKRTESMEATSHINTKKHAIEVERLESMLVKYEAEVDNLMLVKEELEVKLLVLHLELDSSVAQNGLLLDANSGLRTELGELKKQAESLEGSSHANTKKHGFEVESLTGVLVKYEEEIDSLMLVKEELEVKLLVLQFKLDEQRPQVALLEEYKNEMMVLQNKYDEISHRLSEQVLKTEEFKNLSIHLKELKDKADAECLQARDKREEGPPPAMQESLRIVFIKEQYETKLQELKQQLAISKKHSDEMLWKLQDAVNEVENRKKSEASNLKRNEELGMRILELESDLQATLSEKREMMNAYDLMKAEKECSLISLDCCKEEKQELEASLQKRNEEKSKISLELSLMKDFLESSRSAVDNQRRENSSLNKEDCTPNECEEVGADFLTPTKEADQPTAIIAIQPKQDTCGSTDSSSRDVQLSQEDAINGDTTQLALVNDHFKGEILRSSMDHLNKELEKMKYESLLLSEDDHQIDSNLPGLQRELMQLNKVNEELECRFPSFKEFPGNGNALERVLALEIELAEALQEKKKSALHFQSSFLKQHSDEEAIFKSFRDINDLIKDMLEIKGRYTAVETELKEMHGRYSQLSLQFAEVEGERQKLMMTLKNIRASKKVPFLNRSSTAPLGGSLS